MSPGKRYEVRFRREASFDLAGGTATRRTRYLPVAEQAARLDPVTAGTSAANLVGLGPDIRIRACQKEVVAPLPLSQPVMHAVLTLADEPHLAGETVQQWAFRRLRRTVMSGRFPPGQAVTIRGLAEALGTSPMPVREALRRLVAERALVLLDNRRVRVPEMTASRFEQLITVRTLLETEAAARALRQADGPFRAQLAALNRASDEAVAVGDVEATIETNLAFHAAFYSRPADNVLLPLIESIWLQIGPFMRLALEDLETHYPVDRHAQALAALEDGDEAELRRAIAADIHDGIGHLLAQLR